MMNSTRRTKRTLALFALTAAGLALLGPTAEAGTDIKTFVVSTTVIGACVVNVAPLAFPNYRQASPAVVNGTAAFTVDCPGADVVTPTIVTLTLSAAGGFAMSDGAVAPDLIPYQLCRDVSCTLPYVNGAPGPNTSITSSSPNPPQALNVRGQIGAGLTPALGLHQQTVTATLTF